MKKHARHAKIKALIQELQEELEAVYLEGIYDSLEEMNREDVKVETDGEGWNNFMYHFYHSLAVKLGCDSESVADELIESALYDIYGAAETMIEWHDDVKSEKED